MKSSERFQDIKVADCLLAKLVKTGKARELFVDECIQSKLCHDKHVAKEK